MVYLSPLSSSVLTKISALIMGSALVICSAGVSFAKDTSPSTLNNAIKYADGVLTQAGRAKDVITIINECSSESGECGKATAKAAVQAGTAAAAMPVAISIASSAGVTASTGTAIATLSGASAASATSAAVGSTVISATGGALAGVVAPAVIGAVVIGTLGFGVGYLLSSLFD
jgi:hypothetical protein